MRYVVDTHTLVWYLGGDARLGVEASRVLSDPSASLIIISFVFVSDCLATPPTPRRVGGLSTPD